MTAIPQLRPLNTVDAAQAACRNDLDLMFSTAAADVGAAKALCATCTEFEACLEGSLLRREPFGTWGGVGQEEREELFRHDRMGRG